MRPFAIVDSESMMHECEFPTMSDDTIGSSVYSRIPFQPPSPEALRNASLISSIETSRPRTDRKSTRLNSSHVRISYAVFCLKKKKKFYAELAASQEVHDVDSSALSV